MDAAVGVILEALRVSGYGDDTIICFNSDHGTLLGEHGLIQTRLFYDPIIQVADIISYPGVLPQGAVVEDPVELIDLIPTLMDLAGLDIPDNVHGKSLVPQMLGRVSCSDRPVFSEMDFSQVVSPEEWGYCAPVTTNAGHRVMIRCGRWKMSCFLNDPNYGDDGDLYDMQSDPGETRNLYHDPQHTAIIADLRSKLDKWQGLR